MTAATNHCPIRRRLEPRAWRASTSRANAWVMGSVIALSTQPGGFTSGDLAIQVQERLDVSAQDYQPRQAAYDLKNLRGKMLVGKIGKSRLYEAPAEGLRTLVALGMLRDKVLKPVLRMRNLQGPPPRTNNPIDHHYYNLRQDSFPAWTSFKPADPCACGKGLV
jgi:hypothetical protein